jgi:hypothetical protein
MVKLTGLGVEQQSLTHYIYTTINNRQQSKDIKRNEN